MVPVVPVVSTVFPVRLARAELVPAGCIAPSPLVDLIWHGTLGQHIREG
jgi:hypothetical protein